MSAEIGHFALILGLVFALLGGLLPLVGAARGDARLVHMAPPLAIGQFLFVLTAFLCLMISYVNSDFSLMNVALNSHSMKPLLYKISGVWGNHEGSLLLWALILTLFASAVALFGNNLPSTFKARVLSVQSLITVGFLLFMLLTSNPFERVSPTPFEGNGLNPLLQDPGLAFHPPFLYLGYVGFSIAFSFAIAALIEGDVSPAWARWVRPWTLAAWCFLTGGIALGSWWAYYELGWGGWWFWDPVENASFMPWLAGTALLHSAIVVEKRGALKSWTILLAILTFSMSLLGTFIVRSGVITSVHAFASDPARGIYILLFLGITIGGSFILYAIRASKLEAGGLFKPISREGGLIFNNLFLITALATVLFGTLYPLFIDAIMGEKLTVGAPYFEATFVPLMFPLILVLVLGPMMAWKRANLKTIFGKLKYIALFAIATSFIAAFMGDASLMAAVAIGLGAWLALGVIFEFLNRVGLGKTSLKNTLARLKGLPKSQWGMSFAHFGLAVLIFGVAFSEAYTIERLVILKQEDTTTIGDYEFVFKGVRPLGGENYTAVQARFDIFKNGDPLTSLFPEERTYSNPPMQTTEAAIYSMISGDLYVVIGEESVGGGWSVRAYVKPLITWIWFGAMLMMIGGFISLTDRRLRVGMPTRSKALDAELQRVKE